MKSFSQFLNESYLSENEKKKKDIETAAALAAATTPIAGSVALGNNDPLKRLDDRLDRDVYNRLPNRSKKKLGGPDALGRSGQPLRGGASAPAIRSARASLSSQADEISQMGARSLQRQGKTTTVASPTTPPTGPVRPSIGNVSGPASNPKPPSGGKPPTGPVRPSIGKPPSGGKPPTGLPPSATSSAAKETQKAVTKTAGKSILRTLGRVVGPASAALDVADERSKGSGWLRSLAKGATVAAGGALGGAAGSVAGPVGTIGGATAGSMAASKAFDVAAGANAVERKAMATANRQRQAGTAVKGIGGSTSFSQTKPGGPAFMSTGSGSQRRTAQLAKTGVVQRGGQSVAGNLAFQTINGKKQAVYKAGPSAQSLAKTSSNWLERVGRTVAKGAYKAHDAKQAAKKLATARASDAARNKALGVKSKPAG